MQVGRAFLQTFAIQVGQTALSLATGVLIARALGPAGQGNYATVAATVAIGAVVATLGQFQGNVLASAAPDAEPRVLLARSVSHAVALAALGIGLGIAVGGTGIVGDRRLVAILVALVLSLEVLGQLVRGINLGQHHVLTFNLASVVQRVGMFVGVVLLFVFRRVSLTTVLDVWLAALVLSILASSIPIWRRSATHRLQLRRLFVGWTRTMRFGGRAFATLSLTLLLIRADIWVLRPWLGAAAVGQISVASGLAEWLWYVPTIVGNLLFAAVAADSGRSTVLKVCQASRLVIVGTVPLAVALLIFGGRIVELLYGPSFAVAGTVFRLLVPGMMAIAVHLVIDSYFAGIGFPPLSIGIAAAALIGKLALNFVLVPRFGVYGAAAATSCAYVGMLAAKMVWFSQRAQVSFASEIIARREDFLRVTRVLIEWLTRRSNLEPARAPAVVGD